LKEKLAKYHAEKVDDVFKAWTETWLRENYRTWNIEHFLPKITCPSLIIQGENDEFGTLEQVYSIINTVSTETEMFILKDVGHSPHKENKEATLNKSLSFLNKLLSKLDVSNQI
jgi:pimeloyl-ACP methyl ester carboxylesterase